MEKKVHLQAHDLWGWKFLNATRSDVAAAALTLASGRGLSEGRHEKLLTAPSAKWPQHREILVYGSEFRRQDLKSLQRVVPIGVEAGTAQLCIRTGLGNSPRRSKRGSVGLANRLKKRPLPAEVRDCLGIRRLVCNPNRLRLSNGLRHEVQGLSGSPAR